MKYMLLIYDNPHSREIFFGEGGAEMMAEIEAIMTELKDAGELIGTRRAGRSVQHQNGARSGGRPGRHRWAARRGQGAVRRLPAGRLREQRARDRHCRALAECPLRCHGGAAAHGRRRGGSVRPDARVEDVLRDLAPRVLGALVRRYGDFDAGEDAVQEALLAAAVQWPDQGIPDQPVELADRGRRPPPGRSRARRDRAAAARSGRGGTGAGGGSRGRGPRRRPRAHAGRYAHAALPVLPSRALRGLAGRADAARRRRPDDGRDRPRLPRA